MMLYPEVQKRAQAQIDEVVGRDRLPSFADRTSLPYVEAVLWEVMRWNPVTPLGMCITLLCLPPCADKVSPEGGPRASLVDDVYDGYFIPAGSYIIPNVWSVLPLVYLTMEFDVVGLVGVFYTIRKSTRTQCNSIRNDFYLSAADHQSKIPVQFCLDLVEGTQQPCSSYPELWLRYRIRVCPGIHLAGSLGWLAVTQILAQFLISKSLDDMGNEIEPSLEFSSALVRYGLELTLNSSLINDLS
jgi:hypothetical protein